MSKSINPNRVDLLLRLDRRIFEAINRYAAEELCISRAAALRELLVFALDTKRPGWRPDAA